MFLQTSEEEEEEEAAQKFWYKSDRCCDACGDELTYTDEVFVLEVVEATVEAGQFFMDVIHDDENGEALFPPYLLHLECWEQVVEMIDEVTADVPPMEAEEPILKCSRCKSEIGKFEPFVSSQFGELQVSRRRPSGQATSHVERLGQVHPVCLCCMVHVIEDHFEEWEDLLEMLPETEDDEEEEGEQG